MGGQRLTVESDGAVPLDAILKDGVRDRPDVSALASFDREKNQLCVFAWHYHDDDLPGPAADVSLSLDGLPMQSGEARLTQFRIDADHSNSFAAWQRMGSPPQPTPEQYGQLEQAGRLQAAGEPDAVRVEGGKASVRLKLPRQAVALLVVEWERGKP
jgi:xylan 1,4-beta-xylosidase